MTVSIELRDYYPVSEAPKFTAADWNPFESLRNKSNNKSRIEGHSALSGRHLKNALAFQEQHHKNVMEYQSEGYRLEGEHQAKLHGLSEQAESAAHSRTLELHGAINKAAEGGTGIKVAFPTGMAAEYTKAKPKVRPKKSVAPSSFPPVKMSEEPQQEPPVSPKANEGPKPLVKKGPGGKFQSLKTPEEKAKPIKKAKKSESTGPTVGRGPGGKMVSLKKQ